MSAVMQLTWHCQVGTKGLQVDDEGVREHKFSNNSQVGNEGGV